ncbi:MAG: phosphate/phosphite/phosphonate ABC transporter substrate-binding protein [Nitrospinota bacterium]|nr:MAG: phosphate/phosphite/phosphonate ABC transporter substrate-binding protein [Nitrospinota bacterium]
MQQEKRGRQAHRLYRILPWICCFLLLAVSLPAPGRGEGEGSLPVMQVAFIPPLDPCQALDRFQPLLTVWGDQAGLRLRFRWMEDRHRLLAALEQRRIDLALVDGVTYLFGRRFSRLSQLGVVQARGSSRHALVLITREEAAIFRLTDLQQKRYGISDPLEVGHLWVESLLEQQGIDPARFFGQLLPTAGGTSSILDVLVGRIDATVVNRQTFLKASQEKTYRGKIRVIATSPPVSNCVLVARAEMDREVKSRLAQTLQNMGTTLQGAAALAAAGMDGFVHQPDEFFTTEQTLLPYFLRRVRSLGAITLPGY